MHLPLSLLDGFELACADAGSALHALRSIDLHRWFLMAGGGVVRGLDAICRTSSGAHAAADTLLRIDMIFHQVLAHMGRALLVLDMGMILILEM